MPVVNIKINRAPRNFVNGENKNPLTAIYISYAAVYSFNLSAIVYNGVAIAFTNW